MKIDIATAVKAAQQTKDAIASLNTQRSDLIDQKSKLETQVQEIYRAPLRREEIQALIFESIDLQAANFFASAGWKEAIKDFVFPKGPRHPISGPINQATQFFSKNDLPINLQDLDAAKNSATGGLRSLFDLGNVTNFYAGKSANGALDAGRACFFIGDIIKQKIERNFHWLFPDEHAAANIKWDDLPPVDRKREQIELLKKSIAEIDGAIKQVDDQLSALLAHSHIVEKPVYLP